MARVRFTHDFDYKPTSQSTIGYLKGWEGTVRRECAEQAVAAGKAEWVDAKITQAQTDNLIVGASNIAGMAEAQKDGEAEISR